MHRHHKTIDLNKNEVTSDSRYQCRACVRLLISLYNTDVLETTAALTLTTSECGNTFTDNFLIARSEAEVCHYAAYDPPMAFACSWLITLMVYVNEHLYEHFQLSRSHKQKVGYLRQTTLSKQMFSPPIHNPFPVLGVHLASRQSRNVLQQQWKL